MDAKKNNEDKTTAGQPDAPPGFWGALEALDHRLFFFCYRTTKNPVFDVIMPALSRIANRGILQTILITAIITAGVLKHNFEMRLTGYCLIISSIGVGIIAEGTFKQLWKRKRPFELLDGVTARVCDERLMRRPSFPSGHAAAYMSTAVTLALFYPQYAVIFVIIGALGGYSRTYNGVHFPSDVAAGMMIGLGTAAAVFYWIAPLFR